MKKGTEALFVCFAFVALSLAWAANVNDKWTARVPAQVRPGSGPGLKGLRKIFLSCIFRSGKASLEDAGQENIFTSSPRCAWLNFSVRLFL